MAEVRKEPEDVSRAGLAATYHGSLSTGDTYLVRNNGSIILHLKKSGATDCTVTIETPGTVDGLAIGDLTVTVPATTGDKFVGPLAPKHYNDPNGDLRVTFSNITGLTMAVLRTP